MTLFKDLKAMIIAFIVILALSSFLIFPLLAQDSVDSEPDEGSEIPTEQIDETAEGAASPVGDLTATDDAIPSSETAIRAPISFQKPSSFELKDFPNDEGGSFLITWPLTDNEKNNPDSISGYTYRIYHTTKKSDIVGGNIKQIEADEEDGTEANYVDIEPLTDDDSTLESVRVRFWPRASDSQIHAYKWDSPEIPIYENVQLTNGELIGSADGKYTYKFSYVGKSRQLNIAKKALKKNNDSEDSPETILPLDVNNIRRSGTVKSFENGSLTIEFPINLGQTIPLALVPRFNPEGEAESYPDFKKKHFFQLATIDSNGQSSYVGEVKSLISTSNAFHKLRINNVLITVIFCIIILWFITHAKKGRKLFIRKIAGLDAVDEAIGRATEMGRPILYLTGLDPLSNVSTIAAVNILGQVARKVADYDSTIINPNRDPVVMSVCQEVVKEAYMDAGRPDAYNPDSIFFITEDQFSFAAAVGGIMVREKPATNIFMGYYYAESLILAETGGSTGAIQIAGTDSLAQLPFFITSCDYTLIGEELYAASAYLAREPLLLGSLKGQDIGKMFMMLALFLGVILITINSGWVFIKNIFVAT